MEVVVLPVGASKEAMNLAVSGKETTLRLVSFCDEECEHAFAVETARMQLGSAECCLELHQLKCYSQLQLSFVTR